MKELTQEIELFREFTSDELARVAAITDTRTFDPGAVILKQGAPVEAVYVLLEGAVRVTAVMSEGDELVGQDEEVLVLLKPGDVFGELSFITGAMPNLSVIADDAAVIAAISQQGLHQLLAEDNPICRKLLFAMMRMLVGRLRDTGRELVLTRYFVRGR